MLVCKPFFLQYKITHNISLISRSMFLSFCWAQFPCIVHYPVPPMFRLCNKCACSMQFDTIASHNADERVIYSSVRHQNDRFIQQLRQQRLKYMLIILHNAVTSILCTFHFNIKYILKRNCLAAWVKCVKLQQLVYNSCIERALHCNTNIIQNGITSKRVCLSSANVERTKIIFQKYTSFSLVIFLTNFRFYLHVFIYTRVSWLKETSWNAQK